MNTENMILWQWHAEECEAKQCWDQEDQPRLTIPCPTLTRDVFMASDINRAVAPIAENCPEEGRDGLCPHFKPLDKGATRSVRHGASARGIL